MREFGLFNDEGCVDGPFYSHAEADKANRERYSPEDELVIREMCGDHGFGSADPQPINGCEYCED